jgi:gluconolactonase
VVDASGHWTVVSQYDGWPNGMKVTVDGNLLIADHKLGLVVMDPASGRYTTRPLPGAGTLLGLNDLALLSDGSVYVTDQGDTGISDASGRVLHVREDHEAVVVLNNGPSPNGIVFQPDDEVLFVAMTRGNCVWRVPLRDGRAHRAGIAVQLSGGVGPDGLALDADGGLLIAHPPIGVWRFDRVGRPIQLFEADGTLLTNLVIRGGPGKQEMFVTDSPSGRIFTAHL